MARLIDAPVVVPAAGNRAKRIEEFVGRVRTATPGDEGAEYVAVCVPAFSPATVHRDPEG